MGRPAISLVALVVVLRSVLIRALCTLPEVSIDSTLSIAGCYNKTVYYGLYETTVWTIGGADIPPEGATAIVAHQENASSSDPAWSIGTVVLNPAESWSDGYSAGYDVPQLVCEGTSPFWETEDPTEETQWKCDANGDGVRTTAESDFTVTCGCPDVDNVGATTAPSSGAASASTPAPGVAVLTSAPLMPTQSSVGAPTSNATAGQPTPAPSAAGRSVSATPAPENSSGLAPEGLACNLTIDSSTHQDLTGCYVATVSSNSRGKWAKTDGTATVEWEDSNTSPASGSWSVSLINDGDAPLKCSSGSDVDDPTTITANLWSCDSNSDGSASDSERGDFTGVKCSGECSATASAEEVAGDGGSSGDDSTRTVAIIAGSVAGGLLLAGIFTAVFLLAKRRNKTRARGVEPTSKKGASADPSAPAEPIPVFEPWGTRPPPKYYA